MAYCITAFGHCIMYQLKTGKVQHVKCNCKEVLPVRSGNV